MGDCKHHVMAWEYITQGENPRIFETAFFGLGFLLLLLLPRLVVACVATTRCWLDSFCNQRDVVYVVVLVWSSGFVLLLCWC